MYDLVYILQSNTAYSLKDKRVASFFDALQYYGSANNKPTNSLPCECAMLSFLIFEQANKQSQNGDLPSIKSRWNNKRIPMYTTLTKWRTAVCSMPRSARPHKKQTPNQQGTAPMHNLWFVGEISLCYKWILLIAGPSLFFHATRTE